MTPNVSKNREKEGFGVSDLLRFTAGCTFTGAVIIAVARQLTTE